MSSSLSPERYGSARSLSSAEGTTSGGHEGSILSPRSLNFFKSLTERRANGEGNPPKRRGPKPDSKPALTRRQELNRQAQRTHRERKELYIKALEDEVLRLKELYSTVSRDKTKLAEQNTHLKELLAHHGISWLDTTSATQTSPTSPAHSHATGSYGTVSLTQSSAPGTTSWRHNTTAPFTERGPTHGTPQPQPQQNSKGGDFEQAGIDFVLALEKPCMQHMPFLLDRATEADGEPCGHALMASCPPAPFAKMSPQVPFGRTHTHDDGDLTTPAQGTWELSRADLSTLLDLSRRLDLDGEITPVMAWGMIINHPKHVNLKAEDFRKLAEELGRKVRCYGFGAVMEEFELRDAFESVLSYKSE